MAGSDLPSPHSIAQFWFRIAVAGVALWAILVIVFFLARNDAPAADHAADHSAKPTAFIATVAERSVA